MGHYDEAEIYNRRSLELARESGDTAAIVNALSSLGASLIRRETADSAAYIANCRQAIAELMPEIGMLENVAPGLQVKFLTPVVRAYLETDSLPRGKELMERMRAAVAKLPEGHQTEVNLLQMEVLLAKKEHRYADRLALYEKLDTMSDHGRTRHITAMERANAYADAGRYKEAYLGAKDAYRLANESQADQLHREMTEMAAKYDTALKELEIERLSQRQWVLTAIIGICALAIIGGLLIWGLWARNRRIRSVQERQAEYIRGLEQERTRMARELHDDIAGELVGLQFGAMSLTSEGVSERIGKLARRVRTLSHGLMPPEFSNSRLPELIRDFARARNNDFATSRINVTVSGRYDWSGLETGDLYELYRIVQKAINNALKHSGDDSAISVRLEGADKYEISVVSRAASYKDSATDEGVGIRIMRTRAALADAEFSEDFSDGMLTIKIKEKLST